MHLTGLAVNVSENATNLSALRDEDLLSLVAQRNEAALRLLYDRYERLVYSVTLRITGDRQTTEEVVQDVFQNVWYSAGRFQPEVGKCSSWMLGIARHRAIDVMRSKRERARSQERELAAIPTASGPPNLDEEVARRLLREKVRQALDTLPSNQRQAIEFAYYGGMTGVEIAEHLGEPLGTIKTRLRLGLFKLREVLHPFGGTALDDG